MGIKLLENLFFAYKIISFFSSKYIIQITAFWFGNISKWNNCSYFNMIDNLIKNKLKH